MYKKILTLFLAFFLFCGTIPVSASDSDGEYHISDWARENITTPLDRFPFTDFRRDTTREEFCDLIVTIFSEYGFTLPMNVIKENPFTDTENPNVVTLYNVKLRAAISENVIVQGKTETEFCPDDPITRQDAACILFRLYYNGHPEQQLNKRPPVGTFLDEDEFSWWGFTPIYIMASRGIEVMVGDGDNRYYHPYKNLTREQAILAVERLCPLMRVVDETVTAVSVQDLDRPNVSWNLPSEDWDELISLLKTVTLPEKSTAEITGKEKYKIDIYYRSGYDYSAGLSVYDDGLLLVAAWDKNTGKIYEIPDYDGFCLVLNRMIDIQPVSAQNLSLTDIVTDIEYISVGIDDQRHISWNLSRAEADEINAILSAFDNRISENVLSGTGWLGNPKYNLDLTVRSNSTRSIPVRVYDGGYLTIDENRENREIRALSDYVGFCYAIEKELSTRSAGYATTLPSKQKTLAVSDWAREPYDRAWNNGLIPKYMERGFMTDKITREQFCDILILLLQKQGAAEGEPSSETNFSDTRNEGVLTLTQKGIIRGKSDTVFAPNDFLTREEAATILQRTLGCLGADAQKDSDLTFSDDADISDWAKEAVYALNGEGILLGTAENNFSPKSNFTKEQAVVTVLRIYDRLREEKTADEES